MSGLVRAESLFRARRRARRLRSARPALAVAIVTTVVGGVVWVGYASPFLRLTSITVKGTSRLSATEVLAVARVRTGVPLADVPVGAVRRRVAGLTAVARVRVDRDWPHRLVIDVTERAPVAVVSAGGAAGGEQVLLDATGIAFDASTSAPAGLLDLRVPMPVLGTTSAAAAAALRVWGELPSAVRRDIQWMRADSPDAISFELTGGLRSGGSVPGGSVPGGSTVVWGSPTDGADKLAVLAALMRRPAALYDVSTPSVAVTR